MRRCSVRGIWAKNISGEAATPLSRSAIRDSISRAIRLPSGEKIGPKTGESCQTRPKAGTVSSSDDVTISGTGMRVITMLFSPPVFSGAGVYTDISDVVRQGFPGA
jgi:hypothetical protein